MRLKLIVSIVGLYIMNAVALKEEKDITTDWRLTDSIGNAKSWRDIPYKIKEIVRCTLDKLTRITDQTTELGIPCQRAVAPRLQHIISRHQASDDRRPKLSDSRQQYTTGRRVRQNQNYASQVANVLIALRDVSTEVMRSGCLRDDNSAADVWLTVKQVGKCGNMMELQVAIPMPSSMKLPVLCPVLKGKWKVLKAQSFCLQFIKNEENFIEFASAYFQTWKENESKCLCECGSNEGHEVSEKCLQLPYYTPLHRNNSELNLRPIPVAADGDCGYKALGISRQDLATSLLEYLRLHTEGADPIRRELQWQLENMPNGDRQALSALGKVTIDNYIRHFIGQSAAEFQRIESINRHNSVPGEINPWVNYLNLGEGVIPGFVKEPHGLGVIIATFLNRQIIVHVRSPKEGYTETFNPISGVTTPAPLLTSTTAGREAIHILNTEGEAHFDVFDGRQNND